MKLIIITLIALTGILVIANNYLNKTSLEQEQNMSEFINFKTKFNKSYGSSHEYRMKVFLDNLKFIKNNAAVARSRGFEIGVNEFSDLTFEEFSNIYLTKMEVSNPPSLEKRTYNFDDVKVRSVDYTTGLEAVKNQGRCGSCWAFSTIAPIEYAYNKKHNSRNVFSEQHLVDCSKRNNGCHGGLMRLASEFLQQNEIITDSAYPYRGVESSCKQDSITEGKVQKLSGYKRLDQGNTKQLVEFLQEGPVSVAIQVTNKFQFYKSGVYHDLPWTGRKLNHGVTAVGYNLDAKDPYFVIRNSWGAAWGDKGHAKLAVGKKKCGTLGIANNEDTLPLL